MTETNGNKGAMIILFIFLLVCSGLGIAGFTMSVGKSCEKENFGCGCSSGIRSYNSNTKKKRY